MNMLTLSKNFFTSFFHILRLAKKKKEEEEEETKKKFVKTLALRRALLDRNMEI